MIITVVGLGVVGGSFVKALKGQGHEVYGVDVDEETLARAKADGCIKEGFVDGREIIKKSDMTIICLYPSLVLDYIKKHEFKKGSIITDAVGVKTHFLNEAMDEAKSLVIKTLLALIFADNPASLKLFKKIGFKEWGNLSRIANIEGIDKDLLILGQRISE